MHCEQYNKICWIQVIYVRAEIGFNCYWLKKKKLLQKRLLHTVSPSTPPPPSSQPPGYTMEDRLIYRGRELKKIEKSIIYLLSLNVVISWGYIL